MQVKELARKFQNYIPQILTVSVGKFWEFWGHDTRLLMLPKGPLMTLFC